VPTPEFSNYPVQARQVRSAQASYGKPINPHDPGPTCTIPDPPRPALPGRVSLMSRPTRTWPSSSMPGPSCPTRSAQVSLDIVTSNFGSSNVTVLLGNGDCTFGAPIHVNAAGATLFVAGAAGGPGVRSEVRSDSLPGCSGLTVGPEDSEPDCTATSPERSSGLSLPVGCNAVCSSRLRAALCADGQDAGRAPGRNAAAGGPHARDWRHRSF
jgi:hypothetical protein